MVRHFLLALAAPLAFVSCTTLDSASPQEVAPVAPQLGVVSAADPRASEAGAEMLRRGGSATDAAIATMLALTVVEPQSSGIGGGGFYLRGSADGEIVTLDGREKAPAAATPDWFLDGNGRPLPFPRAVLTGLSIGVPGNVRLAAEAHERYGRLEWAELFEPAIALAENGWELTPRFHDFLGFAGERAKNSAGGRALFYGEAGEPLPAGTVVRNPELAATLRHIAEVGPFGFYAGPWAAGMAEVIAEATPGDADMTAADIENYSAVWRPSPCGDYREYRICGMGPPSSGATTVYAILKQLEGYDLGGLGPEQPLFWHLFAESQRLAYADRELYLGDSDFVNVPVPGLMDGDYLRDRGIQININQRMSDVEAGTPPGARAIMAAGEGPEENGTSHFVAVDQWGNAVSYTSTIEGAFGSGHMYGGFFLNNELTDFSFIPERDGLPVANRVQGGKRPRSSMAPTLVFDADGRLVLAIGAAGGGTIPVQVAKALIGVLDFGLPAEEAIALPGLYSPGDTIFVEEGSPLIELLAPLEGIGLTVQARRLPFKANAAQLVDGGWIGAADPRSEGAAVAP